MPSFRCRSSFLSLKTRDAPIGATRIRIGYSALLQRLAEDQATGFLARWFSGTGSAQARIVAGKEGLELAKRPETGKCHVRRIAPLDVRDICAPSK
jgi:hypothetical protein